MPPQLPSPLKTTCDLQVLFKMLNSGVFSEINGCISTGKEANVYHACTSDGTDLAIKVYKTSILVFKDRDRWAQAAKNTKTCKGGRCTSRLKVVRLTATGSGCTCQRAKQLPHGRGALLCGRLGQVVHEAARAWMQCPCCIKAVHLPAQQPANTNELLAGTCVARAASALSPPHTQQSCATPSSLQVCAIPLLL